MNNNKVKATRDSWGIAPMPEQHEEIDFTREFSKDEMESIKNGFIPRDMDDPYFIYFENDTLYIHRSKCTLGTCWYKVVFEKNCIIKIRVNKEQNRGPPHDNEENVKLVNYLIDDLLLKECI